MSDVGDFMAADVKRPSMEDTTVARAPNGEPFCTWAARERGNANPVAKAYGRSRTEESKAVHDGRRTH